ncbi:hypothetical protein C4D60_Mb00t00450 [Musa balbisiana]|uniref:Uncharacterized protein n=1 Tax=Musa balbisiana TaxID=52838 RepID=A0A4S8I5W2_MUSBA|nr:hypothetical protein C4D60_Mb00t00450 [Musa balbisiana]
MVVYEGGRPISTHSFLFENTSRGISRTVCIDWSSVNSRIWLAHPLLYSSVRGSPNWILDRCSMSLSHSVLPKLTGDIQ